MTRFLAWFLATRSGIITSGSSSEPYGSPSSYNRTLPYHVRHPKVAYIRSFGGELESRTLSAQDYLTSELLRTL